MVVRKHVLGDLRPYVCTNAECMNADEDFASRAAYVSHELMCKYSLRQGDNLNSRLVKSGTQGLIVCLFCGEETAAGEDYRGKHIVRHMEEIAFTVVSKPYEEWNFYSDSSDQYSVQSNGARRQPLSFARMVHGPPPSPPYRCERINPATGKPCNFIFSRPYDLNRHEDTIHNAKKQKVRCQYCEEEKTFSRNDALTRHMRVVHPEIDFAGKVRQRHDGTKL